MGGQPARPDRRDPGCGPDPGINPDIGGHRRPERSLGPAERPVAPDDPVLLPGRAVEPRAMSTTSRSFARPSWPVRPFQARSATRWSPARTSASFGTARLIFRSTLRAAWLSLWGDRQGGSTITQQLARSLLLKKEDSFERKLLEAVLAVRISAMLTREEILTRYLNAVPHARNLAGFDGPARYYFGVGVQDLTVAEAALLVGMLPEPNNRDPLKNPASAFEAASGVLRRMLDQDKVTAQQATEAKGELERRMFAGRVAPRRQGLCATRIPALSRLGGKRGEGERDRTSARLPVDPVHRSRVPAAPHRPDLLSDWAASGRGLFHAAVRRSARACGFVHLYRRVEPGDGHQAIDRLDGEAVPADRPA